MTVARIEDETGLDDFGLEDSVIPRLTIVHKEGEFKDSLSNEQFPTLRAIILGLVKQRVLWHTEVDDDDRPMCRSTNHSLGFPNMSDDQPKQKRFPWDKSGFDPEHYPADDNDLIRLPCGSCQLKEWGSHPDGKRPYCSEQFTLPILYDPTGNDEWVPAIITFQKTGLKPLKQYLSSFVRTKSPAFRAITEIGLTLNKRGSTDYSVPNFKKIGDTDQDSWREYAVGYRGIAEFLRADPGAREESEGGGSVATETKAKESKTSEGDDPWAPSPAAESSPEPASEPKPEPKSEAAPAPSGDDDELPF